MVRIVALLVVIAAVVIVAISLIGGDEDEDNGGGSGVDVETVTGPAGHAFTLAKPAGWGEVAADQRQQLPGDPLLVLRHDEQKGLVLVNVQAGKVGNFDKQVRTLDRRLKKAIPDFRKVGARVVRVKAGRALLYSYARTKRGTAHTILVVPAKQRTYTLNGAVPAGSKKTAEDVGRILLSFDI
jgi:hypothetical protein